jgi:hypothetical protein
MDLLVLLEEVMSRRHVKVYPGIFGPNYYSDDMAPEMQISLGSFSDTPIGAFITLILQILLVIAFFTPAVLIAGLFLYVAF